MLISLRCCPLPRRLPQRSPLYPLDNIRLMFVWNGFRLPHSGTSLIQVFLWPLLTSCSYFRHCFSFFFCFCLFLFFPPRPSGFIFLFVCYALEVENEVRNVFLMIAVMMNIEIITIAIEVIVGAIVMSVWIVDLIDRSINHSINQTIKQSIEFLYISTLQNK